MAKLSKRYIKDGDRAVIIQIVDNDTSKVLMETFLAKWEEIKTGDSCFDYRFRCSRCKGYTPDKAYTISPDYCPNCGAEMNMEYYLKHNDIKFDIVNE